MNARITPPDEFGRRMPKATPLLEPDGHLADRTAPQDQRRDGAAGNTAKSGEPGPNPASGSTLPALRHQNIATHWQAADPGGAELMASFGGPTTCPPRRIPPRPSFAKPEPPPSEAPTTAEMAQSSLKRLRATVLLVLLVLTIFLAEPMLRLLARAFVHLARAEAPATLVEKPAPFPLRTAG